MSDTSYRLRFSTADELFDAFPAISEDLRATPTSEPVIAYVERLLSSPTPEEAVTFTAYLLPPREAVWWAHQSLNYIAEGLTELDRAMLDNAEAWVREPEENVRRSVLDAAMEPETKTPGVWVALAAGWSGGSMAPENAGVVPPPPFLTARAVNAAVLGMLARVDPAQRAPVLRAFVDMALALIRA